jgi:response regulator RpfG family c-di-GMP phosphodiesterase
MTGAGETETRLRALARKLEALSAVGAPTSERARVRSEHARVLRAVDAEQALANALLALSEAHSIEPEEPEDTRARTIAACEATVAICFQTVGDDAAALEHALAGLEALGDLEDDLARFRLHNAQAVVYLNFGQADRALASFAEAREAAAHLQDATPLSVLNTNIACVYLEILDQPDRAVPHLDRALAIEGAEPIARVWALQALGKTQNKLGEHERALGYARDAEDIAERHGLLGSVSASLMVAGDALRALQRGDEALAALTRSVEVARRAHAQDMLADSLTALGEAEAATGHTDAARAALEEASELTADRNPARHPLSALASLAAATGDHASAYAYLMRYHEIVQRSADERSRMASSALEVEHQVASVRQEAELARREQQLLREHTDVLEQRVRERTAELEDAQHELIERLAVAAEHRHHETGEHTLRVGTLSGGIARLLGLDEGFVDDIAVAARLHDIGKIAVRDAILLKPGPLTSAEFDEMKSHTLLGAEILSDGRTRVMRLAEEIARSHHERWDGAGYPYGIAAASIPLSGRIVATCDAFDAMLSMRVYKAAMPLPDAMAEIHRGAGAQFDPRVASALVTLVASAPDLITRLYGSRPGGMAEAA